MRKVFFIVALMAAGPVMGQDPGFFLDEWQEKSAVLPRHIVKEKTGEDPTLQIVVDGSLVLGKVPTYIYGNNAVTWGGNMNQHATLVKDLKNLNPHVLRWPGGSLSNQYFWNLSPGEGPDDIPPVVNAQYGMNVESWRMSTPQYYQLLDSTESTGSICVNYSYARYGTGPDPVATAAHLAAEWVRYDSGRSRFWEIGNENFGSWESGYRIDVTQNQDGQPEYINGQLYGRHCRVFIDSMRRAAGEIGVDIKIGVVAYDAETSHDPIQTSWNEGMMPEVGDLADFLIVHSYFTPYNQDSPASVILNSHVAPSIIMKDIMADMDQAGKPMLPVAFTEWNIFAVGSMQQVSFINGMHAALVLGEFVLNDYGMATRWDLTNAWADGDDHGMFSRAGEPGVDLYNPRPVFFYMHYFQKYFGDRMVSSALSGSEEVVCYASTFSSGETGLVLINKGTRQETAEIKLENIEIGPWYHTMTLTGGDDNGEFSRKVFLNGVGTSEEGGGPDDYESVEAFSSPARGGIRLDLPPRSVVYLIAEKPGPFSYISSSLKEDPGVIKLELSEDVQQVNDPTGFTLFLEDGTEVPVVGVERDSLALYQLNLTLARDLENSDVMILSYGGTGILSAKDELLIPFTNEKVSNDLPADPVTVSFHVMCNRSITSLDGCRVLFNGEEEISDASGMASFIAQPGEYLLGIEKEHLEPLTDRAIQVYSDTLFTISLDSASYEVVLQLTDIQTGESLLGVNVSGGAREDRTGSDGLASFMLHAGEASFDLDCFNYQPEFTIAQILSDTLLRIEMLRSHARVKFRLRYGEQPVNKASVSLDGETLISDLLGQSVFPSMPVNVPLEYVIQCEDYLSVGGLVQLTADTMIILQMVKALTGADWSGFQGPGFKIYPNPAFESIFMESRGGIITEVELVDVSGKRILHQLDRSGIQFIDLPSGINPGIYILKSVSGGMSYHVRVLINTGSH